MEKVVSELLKFQIYLRLLHWKTDSYARHMAYGGTYSALDALIDSFVEFYQGKYDRLKGIPNLTFVGLTLKSEIESIKNVLISDVSKLLDETKDTDILNIRDEILGEINKLSYLLTLK